MPLYALFTPGQPGAHQPKFAEAQSDAEALEWADLHVPDGERQLWRLDSARVEVQPAPEAAETTALPPAETRPIQRGRKK